MFPVRPKDKVHLIDLLSDHNVESYDPHPRNDKHDCVREFACPLPNMDIWEKEVTCIPCGWWLSEEETEYIKHVIRWGILN